MRRNHLGYACINQTLSDLQGVCTNRTLRLKTLEEQGLEYLAELIIGNLDALQKVLEWNAAQGYRLYRMSSEMFPFYSHMIHGYEIEDLPRADEILARLASLGEYARSTEQRLTFHPGPFNVLASPNPDVVAKTVRELNCHSHIFDLMGFEPSWENKINIHVGGAYGDRKSALARFCANFALLDDGTKQRLTVENDDRANLYSVKDLYEGVYKVIGIPIVFDYHHHYFNTGDLTEQEALALAHDSWPTDVVPVFHYSESKVIEQGGDKMTPAHSDYISGSIDTYGYSFDLVFEAKRKDQAVDSFLSVNPNWTLHGERFSRPVDVTGHMIFG